MTARRETAELRRLNKRVAALEKAQAELIKALSSAFTTLGENDGELLKRTEQLNARMGEWVTFVADGERE